MFFYAVEQFFNINCNTKLNVAFCFVKLPDFYTSGECFSLPEVG